MTDAPPVEAYLSRDARDREVVAQLGKKLDDAGFRAWPDIPSLEPDDWRQTMADALPAFAPETLPRRGSSKPPR